VIKHRVALTVATIYLSTALSHAGEFTVSPTSLQLSAKDRVATLTVMSSGPEIASGQVRVLRWYNEGGRNDLEPTREMTASPPSLHLGANQEVTIRLLRKSKGPVRGQECYRVLIDKFPDLNSNSPQVTFTIRQSVPLCFGINP
jgi:fimbrial chaperone protein